MDYFETAGHLIMLIIKIFILYALSILLPACQNVEFKGATSGNERGLNNDFIISSSLSETVRFKTKISQPYNYDEIKIPVYSEDSIEILF